MTDVADFTLKRGDRLPSIRSVLSDADGALDLTAPAPESVLFVMMNAGTGVTMLEGTGSVYDGPSGIVAYDWGADDTATAGDYWAEWRLVFSGKRATFPNNKRLLIRILPDLPALPEV